MTTFERIKNLAKEHGMSLNEVNEKANLGTRSIYRWKYKEPSYTSLKKVAKVFNMTPDELAGNSSDSSHGLTWQDLDMPYGGKIPDELKGMYRALAEQYVKDHPDSLKK